MSGLQKAKPILLSLLICVCLASPPPCASSVPDTTYKQLAAWEIDDLTQPVALYPDVILKALLPASTFPDQIVDAALLIKDKSDAELIQKQAWDQSVKVVATYPGVLRTMFEDLDWTTRFGEAYLNQHKDLLASLQRMRTKAKELGNLKTNDKQTVTTQKASNGETVIVIQPTDPEVVYVPTTSTVVYEESGHSDSSLVPLAAFGIGMALGAAINDNDDYYGGGYWGGGPVYWGGDNYNNWSDNRRAAWEDYNDRRWDQQEFRQGQRSDRQDFRQEGIKDGTYNKDQFNQRKDQATSRANDYKAKNPDAAARMDARKSGTGASTRTAAQSSQQFSQRREQANAKMGDYKANNPDAAARMDSRKASGGTQMARAGGGERSSFDNSAFHPKSSQSGSGGLYGGSRSGSASGGGSAFSGYGSRSSTSAMSSRGSSSRSSSGFSGGGGMRGGGGGGMRGGGRGGGGRR